MIAFFVALFVAIGGAVDYSEFLEWDQILAKVVKPGKMANIPLNTVDYGAIVDDFGKEWKATLDQVSQVVHAPFKSHDQFLAYFVNVYNILAVKTVIEHPCQTDIFGNCQPLRSIRDAGVPLVSPVWNRPAGLVNGTVMTLDQVEMVLRRPAEHGFPQFKEDSRIHAAIVCASISCPNLQPFAFKSDTVQTQLQHAMEQFLANEKKGLLVNCQEKTMTVSAIFSFYPKDFMINGSSVAQFVAEYAPADKIQCLDKQYPSSLQYFHYDWNLNGAGLPCSQDRPCYTLIALFITLAGTAAALLLCCCTCCLVRRKRRQQFRRV